jgi:hypothetical protein
MKGAISASEMAKRARAGETRNAIKEITGEEVTEQSRDKKQAEMFGNEVETRPKPNEQDELFSLSRSSEADDDELNEAALRDAERRMRRALHNTKNNYEQAIHDLWQEAGHHGRLNLLSKWLRLYPDEQWLPEWANREVADLPAHVREKIGIERVNQVVALHELLKPSNDDLFSESKVATPGPDDKERDARALIHALENGIGIGPGTQLYDTTGESSPDTLNKIAQKAHTRQLSERINKVFEDMVSCDREALQRYRESNSAVGRRRGSMGVNIQRTGLAAAICAARDAAYIGARRTICSAQSVHDAARGRIESETTADRVPGGAVRNDIRDHCARAGASECQGARRVILGLHTRFAGAAAPVAARALAELDSAWEVAIANGIHDDVITLQREAWNAVEQREYDEGGLVIRPEPTPRGQGGIPVGGDAATAHLRSSEADGGRR